MTLIKLSGTYMGKPKTIYRVGTLNHPNLAFLKKAKNVMKKAKFVLAAIALFAVVGGSLAFKSAHVTSTLTLYTTNAQNQQAINDYNKAIITTTSAQGAQLFWYSDTKFDNAQVQTFLTVDAAE